MFDPSTVAAIVLKTSLLVVAIGLIALLMARQSAGLAALPLDRRLGALAPDADRGRVPALLGAGFIAMGSRRTVGTRRARASHS